MNNYDEEDGCDHKTLQGGGYGLGSLDSGAASTTDALGLGGWATHGIDTYFHGGGGDDDGQRGRRFQQFVLDLDGRRGCGSSGGWDGRAGPTSAEGSGGGGHDDPGTTPFERWKRQKGIFSPGVAQMFGGRTCRP